MEGGAPLVKSSSWACDARGWCENGAVPKAHATPHAKHPETHEVQEHYTKAPRKPGLPLKLVLEKLPHWALALALVQPGQMKLTVPGASGFRSTVIDEAEDVEAALNASNNLWAMHRRNHED